MWDFFTTVFITVPVSIFVATAVGFFLTLVLAGQRKKIFSKEDEKLLDEMRNAGSLKEIGIEMKKRTISTFEKIVDAVASVGYLWVSVLLISFTVGSYTAAAMARWVLSDKKSTS